MEAWCALEGDKIVRLGAVCVPNKVVVKLTLIWVLVGVALLIDDYLPPLAERGRGHRPPSRIFDDYGPWLRGRSSRSTPCC